MKLNGRDAWVIKTSTRDTTGGWQLWNVNSDGFLKDGLNTYTISDGTNSDMVTQVRINVGKP
jgi:hypothetical protein